MKFNVLFIYLIILDRRNADDWRKIPVINSVNFIVAKANIPEAVSFAI
ncbi:MAG: hypothetical protein O8C64_06550 [Candidatus Methanoperedens sp.]|nr:hypothetical protein [Candidatus Methanoperedens sp.]